MAVKEQIIEYIGKTNYLKGNNYNFDDIKLIKTININSKNKIYRFSVESQSSFLNYYVSITTKNNELLYASCSCPQFEKEQSCKHIAACLIKEQEKIFNIKKTEQDIFDLILNSITTTNTKQKINLQIILSNDYYQTDLGVKFKIGFDKLYATTSKLRDFFDIFNGEDSNLFFGKNFTYEPNKQYFSEEDEQILAFLSNLFYQQNSNYYYTREINIPKNLEVKFLKLLKNKHYTIEGYGDFNSYIEEIPFKFEVTKNNEIYKLDFNANEKNIIFFTSHIIIKEGRVYLLNDKYLNIINQFVKYNIREIKFNQEKLPQFAENIYPIIKDSTKINDELKQELTIIDPTIKLYFDFKDDKIICNIKLNYNTKEIDYFDNSNIIRNKEFENNIITDLLKYNFVIDNQLIYIDDIDKIGIFLENDIIELSKKYDVYTTKKLDETNIIKNNKIESQFSIGQDNIMSYKFSIDNINPNEIDNIFNNLIEKKKYYKLKNGNILNLDENEQLKELQNLMEDLDLNYHDIQDGGTIPKYRAIYLDSLKNTKYSIIKTDNLFDNFITNFKKFKNTKPFISKRDQNILRDYQLIGVKWLYNIYKCDLGGILADEMGLGKSIQTICFLKAILKEKENIRILIVSPTSLIYNWQKEFDKYGSELKYTVIAEGKNKRQEILNNLQSDIIITTYGLLRQDKEIYEQLDFEVMIIDEAQNIKNPQTAITKTVKKINAKCKIALTGTPIENSVIELWSIFDYMMPGLLANLTKFQSQYNIKDFNNEKTNVLNKLNNQISPFILRRKKNEVAKDLPEKIENNIYFDMYPEQKKIYIAQLNKTKSEMDEIIQTEGFLKARFKILQLLTKLRQICIDPKIIFENYDGGSVKIDELINLTKRIIENGHKILIFTSFKTALNIVKEKFEQENITSYVIDGSVSSKKRMDLVEKFNHDNTNVFLIMLKAGGTGLNLTSADTVIHLDLWWNPQVENQATDRAHRIGQTKNVEVIKLICNGTIEERIIELQNKKKILSDSLIEGENRDENLIAKLSEKDIKNLLIFDEK